MYFGFVGHDGLLNLIVRYHPGSMYYIMVVSVFATWYTCCFSFSKLEDAVIFAGLLSERRADIVCRPELSHPSRFFDRRSI